MKEKVTALVLAGGKSSRMGEDKALISIEGIPMLQKVCQTAAACCESVYILTPWPERYHKIVGDKYEFLVELNPGNGPLVAFFQGLWEIKSRQQVEWCWLLACDLPCLDKEKVLFWINQLCQVENRFLAIVPQNQGRWEPLCGFYSVEVLSSLENFIEQGGRSFQKWLSEIDTVALPVEGEEGKMLLNCNTPEDLKLV